MTPPASQCDEPISTIDYYPTLLEAARCDGSETHNQKLDGTSLGTLLRDPSQSLDRNLFWHYPHYHAGGDSPYGAVRSGPWRLIEFYENDAIELYDLNADPGENHNLAGVQPGIAEKLHQQLDSWRATVNAQMPIPNPDHDSDKAQQVSKKRK